jgi:hypothetical protein
MATFHTGLCHRCASDLQSVAGDPILDGVAKFSHQNHMDPLFGFDQGAVLKELMVYFREATVTCGTSGTCLMGGAKHSPSERHTEQKTGKDTENGKKTYENGMNRDENGTKTGHLVARCDFEGLLRAPNWVSRETETATRILGYLRSKTMKEFAKFESVAEKSRETSNCDYI